MIYGHEDKIPVFKNLADKNSLAQSYIFHGPPGVGKFLFAKSLACYLEHGEFEASKKSLLDSIIVTPQEGSTGVEDLREVKNFFVKKPFKSSNRLVVIDESEKLTPQAQSSLLKFVEESPNHTIFVFIAKDPKSLLPPLQSRLAEIYFPRLPDREVVNYLIKEEGLDEQKAQKIAEKSFGRIGKALNMLEEDDSEELEDVVENKILNLYLEDKIKNSGSISKLLKKEREIKRFNINPKLQRKAVESIS